MSTAARPTYDGARGGQGRGEKDLSAISKQYSSRDLPSHTKLKYRLIIYYLFIIIQINLTVLQVIQLTYVYFFIYIIYIREHGQGTVDELKNRDFRKELEEREREKDNKTTNRRMMIEPAKEAVVPSAKRQKVDQAPAASLDADDPLDEDDSNSESEDEDDTASLLAELQKIKKERAVEQAKKVNNLFFLFLLFINMLIDLTK